LLPGQAHIAAGDVKAAQRPCRSQKKGAATRRVVLGFAEPAEGRG
jgi:hypothetical protein